LGAAFLLLRGLQGPLFRRQAVTALFDLGPISIKTVRGLADLLQTLRKLHLALAQLLDNPLPFGFKLVLALLELMLLACELKAAVLKLTLTGHQVPSPLHDLPALLTQPTGLRPQQPTGVVDQEPSRRGDRSSRSVPLSLPLGSLLSECVSLVLKLLCLLGQLFVMGPQLGALCFQLGRLFLERLLPLGHLLDEPALFLFQKLASCFKLIGEPIHLRGTPLHVAAHRLKLLTRLRKDDGLIRQLLLAFLHGAFPPCELSFLLLDASLGLDVGYLPGLLLGE
jgi:type III secretory pathway component EscS